MANNKDDQRSIDFLHEWLTYDEESGAVAWRKGPSRRHKAGSPAGSVKVAKGKRYLYLTMSGYEMPMGRAVWAMKTGKWPNGAIQYADGDGTNIRFSNLKEPVFGSRKVVVDGVTKYRMTEEAQLHYARKRHYGISNAEYNKMHVNQGGVCWVCKGDEPTMKGGVRRELSIDHCHATGRIGKLLCSNCNQSLGQLQDDIEIMERAAQYLEKYSDIAIHERRGRYRI